MHPILERIEEVIPSFTKEELATLQSLISSELLDREPKIEPRYNSDEVALLLLEIDYHLPKMTEREIKMLKLSSVLASFEVMGRQFDKMKS